LAATVAIEGISYFVKNLDELWGREDDREFLLDLVTRIEQKACLLGASPHFMCVAEKR